MPADDRPHPGARRSSPHQPGLRAVAEHGVGPGGARRDGDQPDAGLFGPDTVTWRIYEEPTLLLGLTRAILMQLAHPSVAAAVAQHSTFPAGAWRRLLRSLQVGTRISFGDAATSRQAADGLRRLHGSVRGVRADGQSYRADDPDLLLWVWATLVESTVVSHETFVGQLSSDDIEGYYREQQRFAVACGIPDGHWPRDYATLLAYVDEMIDQQLRVTPDARRLAASVLIPPLPAPVSLTARPALELVKLATVGLLPPVVRREYELQWGAAHEMVFWGATQSARRVLALLAHRRPQLATAAWRLPVTALSHVHPD